MRTVDFNRAVRTITFKAGDFVWRYEKINSKFAEDASFYTDAYSADAGQGSVGFGDNGGYQLVKYEVTKPTTVLESKIRSTGHTQYYSTELKNSVKEVSRE